MNFITRSLSSIKILALHYKAISNIIALVVVSSLISINANSQKIIVKELKWDSEKLLFSVNAIDDYTQNLNDEQFIEYLAGIESSHQGFKIPESQQITNILAYENTISNKKKVICPKTFKCAKPIGFYEEVKWGYVQSAFFKAIDPEEIANDFRHGKLDYQKKTHNHTCEKCKNWTAEYKRKVACHACKDTRKAYCGKTVKCPICSGQGYVLEETDSQIQDINSFLDSYNIESCDAYLYYNTPNDFGLIFKNGAKIQWSEKYKNKKIGIIFTQGVRNIKSERSAFQEEQKKNDGFVLKEIELLIEHGAILEASEKFSQLYSKSYYELKYTQNLILKNRINEAFLLSKYLNISDKNIISQLESKKAINENNVKKFLASNNIDSSIFYYKLNPPEKNIKLLIQEKLSELNKGEQEYVIDDKFVKFVKDSLFNKLNMLTSVDNILHINNKGNCTINDLGGNTKLKFQLPENLILRKKYDEFEYTINTKSKFNFFIDTNKYFVKGLILHPWYETIPKGTVVFYYAKKKKKEFILSNKLSTPASKIPTRKYDVLTKLTYFKYEKMENGSWILIINVPTFLNGIPLGDMEASEALYNKCSLNFKNKLVEY